MALIRRGVVSQAVLVPAMCGFLAAFSCSGHGQTPSSQGIMPLVRSAYSTVKGWQVYLLKQDAAVMGCQAEPDVQSAQVANLTLIWTGVFLLHVKREVFPELDREKVYSSIVTVPGRPAITKRPAAVISNGNVGIALWPNELASVKDAIQVEIQHKKQIIAFSTLTAATASLLECGRKHGIRPASD